MALASTGKMRRSVLFIGGLARNKSFLQAELAKSTWAILSITGSGPTIARWSSMPLPTEMSHSRNPTKVPGREDARRVLSGRAYEVFGDDVRVICDHDLAAVPNEPVQIRYGALYIETAAVRSESLANRSAPVANTSDTERQETRLRW